MTFQRDDYSRFGSPSFPELARSIAQGYGMGANMVNTKTQMQAAIAKQMADARLAQEQSGLANEQMQGLRNTRLYNQGYRGNIADALGFNAAQGNSVQYPGSSNPMERPQPRGVNPLDFIDRNMAEQRMNPERIQQALSQNQEMPNEQQKSTLSPEDIDAIRDKANKSAQYYDINRGKMPSEIVDELKEKTYQRTPFGVEDTGQKKINQEHKDAVRKYTTTDNELYYKQTVLNDFLGLLDEAEKKNIKSNNRFFASNDFSNKLAIGGTKSQETVGKIQSYMKLINDSFGGSKKNGWVVNPSDTLYQLKGAARGLLQSVEKQRAPIAAILDLYNKGIPLNEAEQRILRSVAQSQNPTEQQNDRERQAIVAALPSSPENNQVQEGSPNPEGPSGNPFPFNEAIQKSFDSYTPVINEFNSLGGALAEAIPNTYPAIINTGLELGKYGHDLITGEESEPGWRAPYWENPLRNRDPRTYSEYGADLLGSGLGTYIASMPFEAATGLANFGIPALINKTEGALQQSANLLGNTRAGKMVLDTLKPIGNLASRATGYGEEGSWLPGIVKAGKETLEGGAKGYAGGFLNGGLLSEENKLENAFNGAWFGKYIGATLAGAPHLAKGIKEMNTYFRNRSDLLKEVQDAIVNRTGIGKVTEHIQQQLEKLSNNKVQATKDLEMVSEKEVAKEAVEYAQKLHKGFSNEYKDILKTGESLGANEYLKPMRLKEKAKDIYPENTAAFKKPSKNNLPATELSYDDQMKDFMRGLVEGGEKQYGSTPFMLTKKASELLTSKDRSLFGAWRRFNEYPTVENLHAAKSELLQLARRYREMYAKNPLVEYKQIFEFAENNAGRADKMLLDALNKVDPSLAQRLTAVNKKYANVWIKDFVDDDLFSDIINRNGTVKTAAEVNKTGIFAKKLAERENILGEKEFLKKHGMNLPKLSQRIKLQNIINKEIPFEQAQLKDILETKIKPDTAAMDFRINTHLPNELSKLDRPFDQVGTLLKNAGKLGIGGGALGGGYKAHKLIREMLDAQED